jgi:thiamine pyrophosphate-dependent acetolactate synthase large subunit-like protein
MVQVLRDLGIEYAAANPGSSFEGFQESCINYGNRPNIMPEWITALHEESSVTMAHGYGKATGKPMAAVLHGTIGIQHAAMSIYQAYHGKVPMLLIAGRDIPFIPQHSAADMAGIVRSFTKWDALPKTLPEALTALRKLIARPSRLRWDRQWLSSTSNSKKKRREPGYSRFYAA